MEIQDALLRAFVGEKWLALYQNSAVFKDSVTRLAYSLAPVYEAAVEGLAARAQEHEREVRAEYERIAGAPWPFTTP